jgi:nucleotide-binding universal stress UspA family protein
VIARKIGVLNMIATILIAMDGSPHSMKAVEVGSQIAAALKAKLVLLNVAKPDKAIEAMKQFAKAEHSTDRDADIIDILKRGARQMLKVEAVKAQSAGVQNVVVEVEEGPIARTIVARGKHHKADIIVVGSRGLGDIEGLLRGGVSHRVETLAKCPVLVVK